MRDQEQLTFNFEANSPEAPRRDPAGRGQGKVDAEEVLLN